jgi:RNAse (barnase) inhibitor barstar
LRRERLLDEYARLWDALANENKIFASKFVGVQLSTAAYLLRVSRYTHRDNLALAIWQVIESQSYKLTDQVMESRLSYVEQFLDEANKHGRKTDHLWNAIESQPGKFAKRAWGNSLEHTGSFLNVAQKHERDTKLLWDALIGEVGLPDQKAKLDEFAKRTWESPLEKIGSFFNVAQKHGRDTKLLWDALIGEVGLPDQKAKLDEFAKRAWETTPGNVGSFLDVAKAHGRDTAPLWKAIESQPDKLVELIWGAPLDSIGSFFNVAKQHGRDAIPLWEAIGRDPDRLLHKGADAAVNELVGFMHHAPAPIIEILLRDIKPGRWDSTPLTEVMSGATWLAWHCSNVNRDDLASDLIHLLFRRANWLDFPPQSGGFAQVCWLLANAPSDATELVDAFLKTVCTKNWLRNSYKYTSCGQLASGLRQLTLHQSAERIRQFNHKELGRRLNKEMGRFSGTASDDRPQIIQLFGCAWLCSITVSPQFLANIDPLVLFQLLPHRPEAERVEEYQWQFWLGLRAFVSNTQKRLPIAMDLIEETLRLWRVNLAETSAAPMSTEYLINQSMVTWLENCLRANPIALFPSTRSGRWWIPATTTSPRLLARRWAPPCCATSRQKNIWACRTRTT